MRRPRRNRLPSQSRATIVARRSVFTTPPLCASAWSTSLTGCGIKGGACYGKTDATGNRVSDGELRPGDLFATIYKALGINPHKNYYVGVRPIPLVDPGMKPVKEVLA